MEIIIDPKEILPRLQKQVKQNGHSPEHHANLLLHYEVGEHYFPVFFDFRGQGAMLIHRNGNFWWMVGEPIAKGRVQIDIFRETLQYIFAKTGAKKLTLQDWGESLYGKAIKHVRPLGLQIKRPFRKFFWPVYDLKEFGEDLTGRKLKGMRYARNRFSKNHSIEVRDPQVVKMEDLKRLLRAWEAKKTLREKTDLGEYAPMVRNNFPGCDIRRAIFIDGVLRGLTTGWGIPNSRNYYLFMLIHDYSDEYLSEFIALDHFLAARKNGYEFLDFGGSDAPLLNFKKKFHPISGYWTYNFSIEKNSVPRALSRKDAFDPPARNRRSDLGAARTVPAAPPNVFLNSVRGTFMTETKMGRTAHFGLKKFCIKILVYYAFCRISASTRGCDLGSPSTEVSRRI